MPNPDGEEIRLSPSIASILCSRSPLHAWQRHRLLGGVSGEPTDAMDRGRILEALIFNHGKDKIAIIEADSYRTKEAKEQRDDARARNCIPVLAHKLEAYESAVEEIWPQLAATGFEFDGMTQQTILWERDGVKCKGILDHWIPEKGLIIDLKCVDNASPSHCQMAFPSYGYDVQAAAYLEGVEANYPALAGRVRVVFMFCEVEPPYAVSVVEPAGSMKALGKAKWDRAIATWDKCLKTGLWPGYSQEVIRVEAKAWHLDDEMMASMPSQPAEE